MKSIAQADDARSDASYLTVDEARARLRVSRRTLVNELKAGRIPAARVGRQWRIPADGLDAAIRGDRQ